MSRYRFLSRAALAAALLISGLLFLAPPAFTGDLPAPGPRDKCPVCGMFVSRYPDWTASIQFKDGSRSYFDGAKDLLKFWLTPEKYGARSAASAIRVKDYYSLETVDGRTAFYVLGSDVLGPMGKELIPFARRDDAAAFLKDHRGSRILRFSELNADVLRQLE